MFQEFRLSSKAFFCMPSDHPSLTDVIMFLEMVSLLFPSLQEQWNPSCYFQTVYTLTFFLCNFFRLATFERIGLFVRFFGVKGSRHCRRLCSNSLEALICTRDHFPRTPSITGPRYCGCTLCCALNLLRFPECFFKA